MRDDAARAGRTPEAPFGASPHPRLPVFQAPDGGWYVDRDGLTATTERRWRQAFEPRTIRRRARLASLAGLLRAVLLLVGCAALGRRSGRRCRDRCPRRSLGRPSDDVGDAARLGSRAGGAGARGGAPHPGHRPQPATWLALEHGARRRGPSTRDDRYEVEVERPAQLASAARARTRYAATYRAYVEAATDLGLPLRAPAVPLEP
jgi:hypothetical protein